MLLHDTKKSAATLRSTAVAGSPAGDNELPSGRPIEFLADVAWVLTAGAGLATPVLIVGWLFNQ
jgi:hypothetical protein